MDLAQILVIAVSALVLSFYGLRLLKLSLFTAGAVSAWVLATQLLLHSPEIGKLAATIIAVLFALVMGFVAVSLIKLAAFIFGGCLGIHVITVLQPLFPELSQLYYALIVLGFVIISAILTLLLRERLIILLTSLIGSIVFSKVCHEILSQNSEYLANNVKALMGITILFGFMLFMFGFRWQNITKSE